MAATGAAIAAAAGTAAAAAAEAAPAVAATAGGIGAAGLPMLGAAGALAPVLAAPAATAGGIGAAGSPMLGAAGALAPSLAPTAETPLLTMPPLAPTAAAGGGDVMSVLQKLGGETDPIMQAVQMLAKTTKPQPGPGPTRPGLSALPFQSASATALARFKPRGPLSIGGTGAGGSENSALLLRLLGMM